MDHLHGLELILDLHGCDTSLFTEESLNRFFSEICTLIKMTPHGGPIYWHDDCDIAQRRGITGVQLIETSSITVHAFELSGTAFINLFSCMDFDTKIAEEFAKNFFKADGIESRVVERKQ